ncbi:hypothetical protein [Peribacillus sp. R9-11]|uniref:hypothetical protein n=1 Tax=Peribacillus sp. R9-11 TaxID=3073271 RepID=UPI002868973F|nr:hypothetical protein [Peribacillus sp. R9-11]WMX58071.1 hypothetical protein RE409_13105 [Peribacillus sp. R9-11]
MKKFKVIIEFSSGRTKEFTIESTTEAELISSITRNERWYIMKNGYVINLENVIGFSVSEVK